MHVRCEYCGQLRRKMALSCEGCEWIRKKRHWQNAEKIHWKNGETVYSERTGKFYRDKSAFEKDWIEVGCSIEDMLLFACYPVYLSPIGEETLLGEALGNALLPSPVLDKPHELNRAIEMAEPIRFAVNPQRAIVPKEKSEQNHGEQS